MLSLINYVHPSPPSLLCPSLLYLFILTSMRGPSAVLIDRMHRRSCVTSTPPSSRRFPPHLPLPSTPRTHRSPSPSCLQRLASPTSSDAPRGRTHRFSWPLFSQRRERAFCRTWLRLKDGKNAIVRGDAVKTSCRGVAITDLEQTLQSNRSGSG